MAPFGGGEVLFCCPTRQKLRPIQFTDAGKVRRIRGIAYPLELTVLSFVVQPLYNVKTYYIFIEKYFVNILSCEIWCSYIFL